MGDGGAATLGARTVRRGLARRRFRRGDGGPYGTRETRPVGARSRAPFADLDSLQDGSFPLDSDFSLDQAALTWRGDWRGRSRRPPGHDALRRDAGSAVDRRARREGRPDDRFRPGLAHEHRRQGVELRVQRQGEHILGQRIVPVRRDDLAEGSEILWLALWREEEAKAIQGEDEHPVIAPRKRRDTAVARRSLSFRRFGGGDAQARRRKISEHLAGRSPPRNLSHSFPRPRGRGALHDEVGREPQASAARLLPKPARPTRRYFMSDWAAG